MSNQSWGPWISPLADALSRELIIQFEVSGGYGLALYLNVDRCFYNHRAMRIWVQRMLDRGTGGQLDHLRTLKKQFLDCIPERY